MWLDAENYKVVQNYSYGDDISDCDGDECINNIASDLSSIKKSGEPIKNNFAKAINSVIYNAISDEKLTKTS